MGNLFILVSVWIFPAGWMINGHSGYAGIWGEKPALSYFVLTASWRDELKTETQLSLSEWQIVDYMARQESDKLVDLYETSQKIVENEKLSKLQKRMMIWLSGYNRQVKDVLQKTDRDLKERLAPVVYSRLRSWVEKHWLEERYRRGLAPEGAFARSYEIYATRYDSGGAYTVALPDKCLKFSNAGNHLCDDLGYAVGQNYTVFLSYKKSTAATVLEAGPWNVDDNYWAGWGDPQSRRMFADLALGLPEAQAAFFNGYNSGLDQFGRKVTAPYGIDLARQVSIDIGLEPGVNDWITVSFMWTETWGSGSTAGDPNATSQPGQMIQAVQTATVDSSGTLVHEIRFGQTLWAIADAYQVKLQDILTLNGLSEDAIILPGQKLIIQRDLHTATPEQPISSTLTPNLSPTRLSSLSSPMPPNNSREKKMSGTEIAQMEVIEPTRGESELSNPNSDNRLLWLILALSIGGMVLLLLGSLLHRQL